MNTNNLFQINISNILKVLMGYMKQGYLSVEPFGEYSVFDDSKLIILLNGFKRKLKKQHILKLIKL